MSLRRRPNKRQTKRRPPREDVAVLFLAPMEFLLDLVGVDLPDQQVLDFFLAT
jgi:hypothetical protein